MTDLGIINADLDLTIASEQKATPLTAVCDLISQANSHIDSELVTGYSLPADTPGSAMPAD